MQLQACSRLWPGVCRLRRLRTNNHIVYRAFSAQSSEPKATPALLDKIKDKELLKVHGFIGGQWVSASDGTTMEVTALASAPSALNRVLDQSQQTHKAVASLCSASALLTYALTFSTGMFCCFSIKSKLKQEKECLFAAGQEPSYRGSYCHSTLHEGK